MRGRDLQPIAAGVSALLLIAAIGWWAFSAPALVDPGQPTWKGADIVRLKATVPEIAPFDHFHVNYENPFVPQHLRGSEARRTDPSLRVVEPRQPPPRPVQMPPPKAPVVVVEPPRPQLVLPALSAPSANAPVVYGMLMSDGQEMVIVRMSGSNDAVNLKPGDKIAGWTLVSIDSGNLTTFLDPQGLEQRFAIGQGNLAVAHGPEEGAGKSTTPATGAGGQPGSKQLLPGPSGARPLPGGAMPGGADGAIPRPPPREERRRPPKEQQQQKPPPAK
jgi:hypothetical protein